MSVGGWNSGATACKSKNAWDVISARWHWLLSLRVEEALCSSEPVRKASFGSLREPLTCLALGRGIGTKRSKQQQSCHLSIFLVLPRVWPGSQNTISAQEGCSIKRKWEKSYLIVNDLQKHSWHLTSGICELKSFSWFSHELQSADLAPAWWGPFPSSFSSPAADLLKISLSQGPSIRIWLLPSELGQLDHDWLFLINVLTSSRWNDESSRSLSPITTLFPGCQPVFIWLPVKPWLSPRTGLVGPWKLRPGLWAHLTCSCFKWVPNNLFLSVFFFSCYTANQKEHKLMRMESIPSK